MALYQISHVKSLVSFFSKFSLILFSLFLQKFNFSHNNMSRDTEAMYRELGVQGLVEHLRREIIGRTRYVYFSSKPIIRDFLVYPFNSVGQIRLSATASNNFRSVPLSTMNHYESKQTQQNLIILENGVNHDFISTILGNFSTQGLKWKYVRVPPNAFLSSHYLSDSNILSFS